MSCLQPQVCFLKYDNSDVDDELGLTCDLHDPKKFVKGKYVNEPFGVNSQYSSTIQTCWLAIASSRCLSWQQELCSTWKGINLKPVANCERSFVINIIAEPIITNYRILLGRSWYLQPLERFSSNFERWITSWCLRRNQRINRLKSVTSLRSNSIH